VLSRFRPPLLLFANLLTEAKCVDSARSVAAPKKIAVSPNDPLLNFYLIICQALYAHSGVPSGKNNSAAFWVRVAIHLACRSLKTHILFC
jgi:hypothetical protein